ncbi:hypothetical protein BS47DRAFT_1364381 [Hydnum rufescens UP504]|uniref:Uncharacterized protein n=1 Tax=Hydnum rufescens UP504 TaxID=1448309 RepID=A0A9P6ASN5_9AGAM|nr:hypothetical protein BS47DRAFT_1364381 [Hydnum rufescens UP504]
MAGVWHYIRLQPHPTHNNNPQNGKSPNGNTPMMQHTAPCQMRAPGTTHPLQQIVATMKTHKVNKGPNGNMPNSNAPKGDAMNSNTKQELNMPNEWPQDHTHHATLCKKSSLWLLFWGAWAECEQDDDNKSELKQGMICLIENGLGHFYES